MIRRPPRSPLFPYPPLSRSLVAEAALADPRLADDPDHLALAGERLLEGALEHPQLLDRKSTRLNSSHDQISYAVFCLKKKKKSPVAPRIPHHTCVRRQYWVH